jgi:hypothetical protein
LSFIRTFFWSFLVTILGFIGAYWYGTGTVEGGLTILAAVVILSILEVSFSFDNAVINATVLRRMSKFWQTIFLTIGIAIAVFGMRLIFPLLLVTFSAGIGPIESLNLALNDPPHYKELLEAAHPTIAAFGGVFLLMIFLDFVFEDRDVRWLRWLERPLATIGKLDQLSVVITLGALALIAQTLAPDPATVLIAGVLGLFTYLLVNGLSELFEAPGKDEDDEAAASSGDDLATARQTVQQAERVASAKLTPAQATGKIVVVTGRAAFFLFLYLEVLDASFSFDGVVGAFAISSNPFVIALGLGIGAMYVRSITVYLVNRGTLDSYVYLEHGAHWAIGALAVILLLTIKFHINEVVTGLIGVIFILASVYSSVRRNRRLKKADAASLADKDSGDRQLAQV